MKKLLLALCFIPLLGFGQLQGKFETGVVKTPDTNYITASVAYPFNVDGFNYGWTFIVRWDTSVMTKTVAKVEISQDGSVWFAEPNTASDSIKTTSGYKVFEGDHIYARWIRLYMNMYSGDTLRWFGLDYSFKKL